MRADALCILVFTLWAATYEGTASKSKNETHAVDPFVEASHKFSVALMKEVFKRPGNSIFSPLSVSTLLAMLQQGAHASSAQQLETVLHMKRETALKGFHRLISNLKDRRSLATFNFGNSMFVNQDFDLLVDFREAMVRQFRATVESVDFRYPARAVARMNAWVSNSTAGKIPEVVKADAVGGRTEMILANVMYFKGPWYNPFYHGFTKRLPFYRKAVDASPVTADMMTMNVTLHAGEDVDSLNAKWIDLPYEGFGLEYSMFVVLPNDNLDDMMTRLTPAHISAMTKVESVKDVTLQMPRFKIETDLSMVPTLRALGLEDVFNQNSNLEGISTNKGPLIVSDVLHKAVIEVNEDGSEAAATTTVLVNTLSLTPEYGKMSFVANKPFLAMIVDKASSLPLFVAKVSDPSKTQ